MLGQGGATRVSRSAEIWSVRSRNAAPLVVHLGELGLLRFVEPNRMYEALRYVDPLAQPPYAWHLYAVGAADATPPGPGFPVTVIDSGFDPTHRDFAGRPNTELTRIGTGGVNETHATFVASTAAAATNGFGTEGIYPQASLRVFDLETLTEAGIIPAIDQAIARGPSVINLSLGGPEVSYALYSALIGAFGTGSLVVAASGNSFEEGNPLSYPASFPHVLTVAATDQYSAPASFSSSSWAVDLAAPGVAIPIAHPTDPSLYLAVDGTSFSAPIVSAAAAWARTMRPMHVTQLFDLLRWNARDIAEQGFDERTGYGLLSLPTLLSAPLPAVDPREPNDDIDQVRASGLFVEASPPLNTPTSALRRVGARLDVTEDPHDVYNILVGPGRRLTVTATSQTDIVLELWRSTSRTVWTGSSGRLAHSDRAATETVTWTNRSLRTQRIYGHIAISEAAETGDGAYSLAVRTARVR